MSNSIISFFIKWTKKEINRYIISFISGGLLIFFNRIGALPDIPFIVCIIICLFSGFTLLYFNKYFYLGKVLIIIGICMIPFIIRKNNIAIKSFNDSSYTVSCDELIRNQFQMDSVGWALYEERQPELLAWMGCTMIESFIKEDKQSFVIPELKYADSLLNESRKEDVAYAYLGRAMKEYYGLGGNKSIKEAVRDAQICIDIKHCDQAYSLLEQMNLDTTDYHYLLEKVHKWRDSLDNLVIKSYSLVNQTFIPNWLPPIIGLQNERLRVMAQLVSMQDALYIGDKSSNAWKVIHENNDEIKKWGKNFYGLLAAYYWGIGKADSARIYCDSIGSFYNDRSQFYNFSNFKYNENTFERDVIKSLDDVLHYSSIDNLGYYASISNNPYLKYAFETAKYRKDHLLNIKDQNDAETMITIQINAYIKQLRPRLK
jgi:hypothetical protein